MNLNTYFSYWAELYKEDMMNNIMPFWMKYGLDTQNGGIYTCVGRDGQLLDTTKSVWFQGRSLKPIALTPTAGCFSK